MIQALLNVVLGMGTVFIVLAIIYFIISCFRIFPYIEKKRKERNEKTNKITTDDKALNARSVSETEPINPMDDMAIVAAITAAITAYTGISEDGFVVRSIVRRKGKE